MRWIQREKEDLGTAILRFISIRTGLIAPSGLSVSVLQIPGESLPSKFQAKFKKSCLVQSGMCH